MFRIPVMRQAAISKLQPAPRTGVLNRLFGSFFRRGGSLFGTNAGDDFSGLGEIETGSDAPRDFVCIRQERFSRDSS